VEGIAVSDNEVGLFVEKIVIPAEGETVELALSKGTSEKLLGLFPAGAAVYLNKKNGYYTVEKTGSFSLTLRRQAQPSPMVPGPKTGDEAVGVFCKLANGTADVVTRITACDFDGAPFLGSLDGQNSLDPAIRIDAGEFVISGNSFISAKVALLGLKDESAPYGQRASLISNNFIEDDGKRGKGPPRRLQVAVNIIGGTIEGNAFIIKDPEEGVDLWCLEVGWGAGGSSVLRGNVFRSANTGGGGKVSAIGRNSRIGKMVAEGNVFDGVGAGVVEDPSANFEGKNIKMP
jgi:hypothetical protein